MFANEQQTIHKRPKSETIKEIGGNSKMNIKKDGKTDKRFKDHPQRKKDEAQKEALNVSSIVEKNDRVGNDWR